MTTRRVYEVKIDGQVVYTGILSDCNKVLEKEHHIENYGWKTTVMGFEKIEDDKLFQVEWTNDFELI